MLNFTFEALEQARAARNRIRDFIVDVRSVKRDGLPNPEVTQLIEVSRSGFIAGLENDLNISESLASLFSLIEKANFLKNREGLSRADAKALEDFILELDKQVLGIEPTKIVKIISESVPVKVDPLKLHGTVPNVLISIDISSDLDPDIQKKVDARQKARAEKNFKLADQIRDELLREGILLEDTKDGVRWKKVGPQKP
jgi:cysteinyl-tRNA synthetase